MDKDSDLRAISIDNNPSNEISMIIDFYTTKEYFLSAFLFVFFVFIVSLSGFFGPPQNRVETKSFYIDELNESNIYHSYNEIKPNNIYNRIYLTFIKKTDFLEDRFKLTYSTYFMAEKDQKRVFSTRTNEREVKIRFRRQNHLESDPIVIFNDYNLVYDSLELRLSMSDATKMEFIRIHCESANVSHTKLQMFYQYLYIVAGTLILILYMNKCREMGTSLWQKMNQILLVLSILGMNPLFALEYFRPSIFIVSFNFIFMKFFESFVAFFIIVTLDDTRLRNTTKGKAFMVSKMVYFLFRVVVETFFSFVKFGGSELFASDTGLFYINFAYFMKIISDSIFVSWFIILFIVSIITMDETERKPFFLLGFIYIFVIIQYIVPYIPFSPIQETSLLYSFRFGTYSALAIAMSVFTYPYNSDDQIYENENSMDDNGGSFEPDVVSDG